MARIFASRPRVERVLGDRAVLEAEAEAGAFGQLEAAGDGLELAVDQAAEIEHLVVGEELDELRVRRRGDKMDVQVVEPVRTDVDAVARRGRSDAAELG